MSPAVAVTVIAAGAIGTLVRYATAVAFARPDSSGKSRTTPWAVLVVNVVGSGIAGIALALALRGDLAGDIRLIIVTGLCGGLTTFSTLSVESVQLVLDGRARVAIASIAGNLALGIAAAAIGFAAISAL